MMIGMDIDNLVKKFDSISKAFNTGVMEPQLVIGLRHGWAKPGERFYASFNRVWVLLDDGFGGAAMAYGNGSTPEEAMRDYLRNITGKTLIYHINCKDEQRVVVV